MRRYLPAAAIGFLVSCTGGDAGPDPFPPPPGPVPIATITVSPGDPSVVEGATVQLTATAHDAQAAALEGREFTWSSNATNVASVSQAGVVTGVSAGTARIRATAEGKTGESIVNVILAPVATVTVGPGLTIEVGTSAQLNVRLQDAQGEILSNEDRIITWNSASSGIANVNLIGLVTGISPGETTITATSEGKSGSVTIKVTAP